MERKWRNAIRAQREVWEEAEGLKKISLKTRRKATGKDKVFTKVNRVRKGKIT